jgi:DNA-binding beta-propeller fold protein YncE
VEPGTGRVHAAQRNTSYDPIHVFDREGNHLSSWGSQLISKAGASWGVHGMNLQPAGNDMFVIWITDVTAHTVMAVVPPSTLLRVIGTRGTAGNGTQPLQFGNVADVDFGGVRIFISDGDGGVNNRVSAFGSLTAQTPTFVSGSAGVQPGQFNSPHSITYHAASDTLFVADRGNNRTQQLAAATGKPLGEWTCMRPGTPWGLRVLASKNLLFQADGNSHTVQIFSLDQATPSGPGPCTIVQTIDIPPAQCSTPHEVEREKREKREKREREIERRRKKEGK